MHQEWKRLAAPFYDFAKLLIAMKLFAVIVLLLTGCASVNQGQVSPQTRENALNAQEKWLRGLERGQPIQETTVAIVPGTQYLLEIFQHGTLYQYISGMYPNTGVLYGLYFEAGRLKALLLDQDAIIFSSLRAFIGKATISGSEVVWREPTNGSKRVIYWDATSMPE